VEKRACLSPTRAETVTIAPGGPGSPDYPCPMSARAVPAPLAQLPNALTIFRLVLVPVFVVLLATADGGRSWPAAIVFGVAGVTDQLDGWLARRWHVESEFGKVADPLADRLMIDAAVVLLVIADRLPWIALAVVVARDVLLLGGYRLVMPRGYELSVNALGKAATWLLYLAIGCIMVTSKGTDWPLWLFWSGLALAVAAGALYIGSAWKAVRT
jgi:CDP-diacylglycerol--glycerol-3-phosphate 3-phosphatidyltransferase